MLASGSADCSVIVWDLKDRTVLLSLAHPDKVTGNRQFHLLLSNWNTIHIHTLHGIIAFTCTQYINAFVYTCCVCAVDHEFQWICVVLLFES